MREGQKEQSKDLAQMKVDIAENRKDINHHIERTDQLQTLNVDNKKRIDLAEARIAVLEEPVKAKAWIKKNILSLASLITAISSLVALGTKIKGLW